MRLKRLLALLLALAVFGAACSNEGEVVELATADAGAVECDDVSDELDEANANVEALEEQVETSSGPTKANAERDLEDARALVDALEERQRDCAASATPTATATPQPTATQTPTPTATPEPTATPQPTSTPAPTSTPTPDPTATPTPEPTATPDTSNPGVTDPNGNFFPTLVVYNDGELMDADAANQVVQPVVEKDFDIPLTWGEYIDVVDNAEWGDNYTKSLDRADVGFDYADAVCFAEMEEEHGWGSKQSLAIYVHGVRYDSTLPDMDKIRELALAEGIDEELAAQLRVVVYVSDKDRVDEVKDAIQDPLLRVFAEDRELLNSRGIRGGAEMFHDLSEMVRVGLVPYELDHEDAPSGACSAKPEKQYLDRGIFIGCLNFWKLEKLSPASAVPAPSPQPQPGNCINRYGNPRIHETQIDPNGSPCPSEPRVDPTPTPTHTVVVPTPTPTHTVVVPTPTPTPCPANTTPHPTENRCVHIPGVDQDRPIDDGTLPTPVPDPTPDPTATAAPPVQPICPNGQSYDVTSEECVALPGGTPEPTPSVVAPEITPDPTATVVRPDM